jgi:hypothetical protein
MIVYHGSTKAQCLEFTQHGIDAHLSFPRIILGPLSHLPGLFVTPDLEVAKRFGRCVVAIEVQPYELTTPPLMEQIGITTEEALQNPKEPQAFIRVRIEPSRIKIVHSEHAE